jgi:1,4-dihydroxy-2-naphthoyl-CoA synthase
VRTAHFSPSDNGRGSDAWARSWTHLRIDRRTLGYCRVTFDHPPVNAITTTTVLELTELVGLIDQDADLNVVVFDSANPAHYLGRYEAEVDPLSRTGMDPWRELPVRLSRVPAVSIASIRGCVGGAGREFVRLCDLRFASRGHTTAGRIDVDRVIADDRLDDEVDQIASRIARLAPEVIARAKADRALPLV